MPDEPPADLDPIRAAAWRLIGEDPSVLAVVVVALGPDQSADEVDLMVGNAVNETRCVDAGLTACELAKTLGRNANRMHDVAHEQAILNTMRN